MDGKGESGARLLARARKGVKAEVEALIHEVDGTTRSECFDRLIGRMAWHWHYSFHNQHLIAEQRPTATRVRGKSQWAREGRVVRKGEQAILIYTPGSDTGWPFRMAWVFDVLQTDGPEGAPRIVREAEAWLPAIEAAAQWLGIALRPLSRSEHLVIGLLGNASPDSVGIRHDLAPHERIRVLCHEYAHVLLHLEAGQVLPPREQREMEAEAVSHVVCRALEVPLGNGLESAAEYIVWNGASTADLTRSLRRITSAGKAILTAIEGRRPRSRIPAWKAA
ncbi:MAG: hypothetical protein P1V51_23325 [Deltaproteobacteria bacterium]|nr:hypothetical protein [Deltaproteobacteria bacterium]